MKILVINGVNLDMLGTREPEIYGGRTLDDINSDLSVIAKNMGADIDFVQSNIHKNTK